MNTLVLTRLGREGFARLDRPIGELAADCAALLRRARRDGLPVIHLFPDWPPGQTQLQNCEPVRTECIISSISGLKRALTGRSNDGFELGGEGLIVSGLCEPRLYYGLVKLAREHSVSFEVARVAFRLVPVAALAAPDSSC